MKYFKVLLLLGCVNQMTEVINTIDSQEANIAQAEFGTMSEEKITEVIGQIKLLAKQNNISFQAAADQLAEEYGVGSGPDSRGGHQMTSVHPIPVPAHPASPSAPQKKTTQAKLINRIVKNIQSLQNDVTQLQKMINA